MIKLKNIEFSYSKDAFIEDLNLNFTRGEMVSVLGPNGSGKSTIIKLLTGELKAKSGDVIFENRAIHEIPVRQLAQRMAVMTQNAAINFPYTCLEVVQMGLFPHKELGVGIDTEEVEHIFDLMRQTETESYAEKLITEVSGGEAQRVLLTRILAQDTPVIILDEAFSAMDVAHRVDMLGVMKRQVELENKAVIAVMHDLNMAYLHSDRIIMMKNGRVYVNGPTDEVMTPDNLYNVFGINVLKVDGKGFLIET